MSFSTSSSSSSSSGTWWSTSDDRSHFNQSNMRMCARQDAYTHHQRHQARSDALLCAVESGLVRLDDILACPGIDWAQLAMEHFAFPQHKSILTAQQQQQHELQRRQRQQQRRAAPSSEARSPQHSTLGLMIDTSSASSLQRKPSMDSVLSSPVSVVSSVPDLVSADSSHKSAHSPPSSMPATPMLTTIELSATDGVLPTMDAAQGDEQDDKRTLSRAAKRQKMQSSFKSFGPMYNLSLDLHSLHQPYVSDSCMLYQ